MKNSKLIEVLKTFTKREYRQFGEFLKSPIFNKNEALVDFYGLLRKAAPDFFEKKIERHRVFSKLYPKKKYDDKTIKYLMSFTLKLCEKYMAVQKLLQDELTTKNNILYQYADRKLGKHYDHVLNAVTKSFDNSEIRDASYFYKKYFQHDIANQWFLKQKVRTKDKSIQMAADALDLFYFSKKLQFGCEMLDRQHSILFNYRLQLLDEIIHNIEEQNIETPSVKTYALLYKMLMDESEETHFYRYIDQLNSSHSFFSKTELNSLYYFALNYAIRKIRKGKESYVDEALNLYMVGIENRLLFEGDKLSPWTYKNVVKLGLRLQKFEFTESFIHEYYHYIEAEFRENALNYNLADLNFYLHKYDKAQQFLARVEFTDVYYTLHTKVMLLKIFYESENIESLFSLITSFKQYIKRNKKVAKEVLTPYWNFITLLAKLVKAKPGSKEKIYNVILDENNVTDKSWLLEKAKK